MVLLSAFFSSHISNFTTHRIKLFKSFMIFFLLLTKISNNLFTNLYLIFKKKRKKRTDSASPN